MSYKNIAKLKRAVPSLAVDCSQGGRTQQNFRKQCDINTIMEKARKGGIVNHFNNRKPLYGDFTLLPPDYQTALNNVIEADEKFKSLPASIRNKFDNDPQKLLNFIWDDSNYDEAAKLGLVPEKAKEPTEENLKQEVSG